MDLDGHRLVTGVGVGVGVDVDVDVARFHPWLDGYSYRRKKTSPNQSSAETISPTYWPSQSRRASISRRPRRVKE